MKQWMLGVSCALAVALAACAGGQQNGWSSADESTFLRGCNDRIIDCQCEMHTFEDAGMPANADPATSQAARQAVVKAATDCAR